MDTDCLWIKTALEEKYDLPFVVKVSRKYGDPVYTISPVNELNELFEVKILIRQQIRMIIEIKPQKYAADMMDEVNKADINKKNMFKHYVEMLHRKGAKVEFFINKNSYNAISEEIWNEDWGKFDVRITKILSEELTDMNVRDIMLEWSAWSVGLLLSLLNIEELHKKQYLEGKISQVLMNRYERNPINRELCLAANGYICKVCGFDFEEMYGEIGKKFIHVHHLEMVSSFGGEYYFNPEKDMIPVCPNCHAMLHKTDPPMQPKELVEIIAKNNRK